MTQGEGAHGLRGASPRLRFLTPYPNGVIDVLNPATRSDRIAAERGGMRRKVGLFFVGGLLLPLLVSASASAQGSTMRVTPKNAGPGQVVNVRSFNGSFVSATGTSAVLIRLDTRWGRVLRSTTADTRGNINVDIPIPDPLPADLQPGWHLLIASQTIEANGRQRSFTPARTRVRITATPSGASSAAPGGRGGLPDSPVGLLALGSAFALLGTGAALTARRLRTLNRPPLGS